MNLKYKEEIIEVPGFQIGIKRRGSPDKHPVLAFHGLMDNAASFDFLGPLLSTVHLIAVDSPGCGKSSHYPPGILPQWMEECFLMYHLVNQLKLEKFSIMGHSRGSILVTIMAAATPERIENGVILEALGPPVAYSEKMIDFLRRGLDNYLNYESHVPKIYKDLDEAIKERMAVGTIAYKSAKAIIERGMEKVAGGYVWTYDRRLHSMGANFPFDDQLKTILQSVTTPLCLIRATGGVKYPQDIFERRKSYINNLEYHELPGGHHVHMDNAPAVADILNSFYFQ